MLRSAGGIDAVFGTQHPSSLYFRLVSGCFWCVHVCTQRDPFSPAPCSLAASCCSYRYGAIAIDYIRASCVVSSPSVDSCSPICSSAYRCVRVCFSCTRSNLCHVVHTHAWSQCFATQKYRFPHAVSFNAVAKPHAFNLS